MSRQDAIVKVRHPLLPVGTQLELQLDDVRREDPEELTACSSAASEPWEGVSPRVLTRSYKLFSLGAPPPWGLRD